MTDPWIHRSAQMQCQTCMYYVPKLDLPIGVLDHVNKVQGKEPLGRCRRHAPTMNGFPVVYPMDWCGDHKLDGAKL